MHNGPKIKARKEKPMPFLFPLSLYSAIRSSCIYLSLSSNADNILNRNSVPMVKNCEINGINVDLFCYTPDLLKMWLRFLVTRKLWSRIVTVSKAVKSKSGYSTYGSSGTNNVTCLHLPSNSEMSASMDHEQMTLDELRNCVNQISSFLLNIGPLSERLVLPSTISPNSIPEQGQVTTPGNITKQDRIATIGYMKCALDQSELNQWNDFYTMEVDRYKYILAQANNTKITDASIRSLNEIDRAMYNQYAISNYVDNMSQYNVKLDGPVTAVMNKINGNNNINPAIIAFQQLSTANKGNKTDGVSSNRKYLDMIEKYCRLTRYKLDIKAEKAAKTLQYRYMDIEWMESLLYTNRMITFSHNQVNNRAEILGSTMQQVPMIQQSPTVTSQAMIPVTQQQHHTMQQASVSQQQQQQQQQQQHYAHGHQQYIQNNQPQKPVFSVPTAVTNPFPVSGTTNPPSFVIPNFSRTQTTVQPVVQPVVQAPTQSAAQESDHGLIEDELFD
jgi:hypothetical protein